MEESVTCWQKEIVRRRECNEGGFQTECDSLKHLLTSFFILGNPVTVLRLLQRTEYTNRNNMNLHNSSFYSSYFQPTTQHCRQSDSQLYCMFSMWDFHLFFHTHQTTSYANPQPQPEHLKLALHLGHME